MTLKIKLSKLDVTLYPGEPGLFVRDPDGPVIRDLRRRMTRAKAGAQTMVRKRTGRLFASIRMNDKITKAGPYVEVIAGGRGFKYTMVEHDGSRPHIIRARFKKSLRFQVAGKTVFRKQVRHPGTTGTKFLERALPLAGG